MALAEFAAELATIQLNAGCYFLIEHPRGSDLFRLKCHLSLLRTGRVFTVDFPQCALGMRVHGEPILKWTTLWATSPLFLRHFQCLQCTRTKRTAEGGRLLAKRTRVVSVFFGVKRMRFHAPDLPQCSKSGKEVFIGLRIQRSLEYTGFVRGRRAGALNTGLR